MKSYARGAKYTPLDTPYRIKFVGDKVYPFPSLTQLNVFKRDVENIVKLYSNGSVLYDIEGNELGGVEKAIEILYNERYEKWLKTTH